MKPFLRRIRTLPIFLLVLVVILVAARVALPWGLKKYINQTLNEIPGYYGYVADVDVALWRGAYSIEGVDLIKTNGVAEEPFFAAEEVDISLDWRALFDGRLVSKITLIEPKLQFIERAQKETSQTKIDKTWQSKVTELYPFEINRFEIVDGLIRYKDQTKDPKINFYLDKLDLVTTNISNTTGSDERLPSDLIVSGELLETGKVSVKSKVNFLAEPMEADINGAIRELSLKEINDFAKAYGNFDFEKGTLDVTLELAASKSQYEGYVKTLAKSVDIVDWSKESKKGDSVGHLLWEGLVGSITQLFKNGERDQFAARIPLEGSRKQLAIDSWATAGSILRNAFVQALSPQLEGSVDFQDAQRGQQKGTVSGTSNEKGFDKKSDTPITDQKPGK